MKLHHNAAPAGLVALLRRLMAEPSLDDFELVGGTSLALQFGHRISIDIDLFTASYFDAAALAPRLTDAFGLMEVRVNENSLSGIIAGIKIDLLAHRYPTLQAGKVMDGIRFMSVADGAAMKLNAIANRGSKKDFWDLHELLRHFTIAEMFDFYRRKYPSGSLWQVQKSLSYFDDADAEPDPRDLRGIGWTEIKAALSQSSRF